MSVVSGHCFIKKFIYRKKFHQDGYPYRMFDNCVNKFFSNKFNPKAKDQSSKKENNRCIILPYVGNASIGVLLIYRWHLMECYIKLLN